MSQVDPGKKSILCALVVLLVVMLHCTSHAGQPDNVRRPGTVESVRSEGRKQMVEEDFGFLMEILARKHYAIVAQPEVAEDLAAFTKNYYAALLKKGFAKEDALKIVIGVGLPYMQNLRPF